MGEPVVSYWVLRTVKVASRSGKNSKRKTPRGYHAYDHSISVTHVCLLEVLNMNINYFVSAELHPVNKAPVKSSLTAYFALCSTKSLSN